MGKKKTALSANPETPHSRILTADEDLDLVTELRRRDVLLDHLVVHVPLVSLPARVRLVDGVDDIELVRVFLLHLLELLAQQDVLLGDVCEDECELGLVRRICQRIFEDLVHWSARGRQSVGEPREQNGDLHATAACDHADLVKLVDCTRRPSA